MYPIVIFAALRVKIRDADSRTMKNKAAYVDLNRLVLRQMGLAAG